MKQCTICKNKIWSIDDDKRFRGYYKCGNCRRISCDKCGVKQIKKYGYRVYIFDKEKGRSNECDLCCEKEPEMDYKK